jgi:hypothetical protein
MRQKIAQNKRMLEIYDRDKNNKDPSEVAVTTSMPIYWKCLNTCNEFCKHEWIAPPKGIYFAKRANGCPWCSRLSAKKPCCIQISVAGNERLLSLWCKERNDNLGLYPEKLRCNSSKKVWWKCAKTCNHINCKHEWQTSIANVHRLSDCPFCAGSKVCCFQKSAAANPILVHSFDKNHPENLGINLENLTPHSHTKVWWICYNICDANCHHSWKTRVAKRQVGQNCPYCSPSKKALKPCCWKKSCANLKYTETMKDFDYKLYHPQTPADFFTGSYIKLSWKCYVCGLSWFQTIKEKLQCREGGCVNHRSNISNGEFECRRVLKEMNIPFLSEFKLIATNHGPHKILDRSRYDFYFVRSGNNYLLEFDGAQHFTSWKNEPEAVFQDRQQKDIDKTNAAILEHYFIIRIYF